MILPDEDELELELEDELEHEEENIEESSDEAEGSEAAAKGDVEEIASQRGSESPDVKPSRAETRVQALANARREAEERAAKAEARAQQLEAERQQQYQQAQFAQQQQQYAQQQYYEQQRLQDIWANGSTEDRVAMMLQRQQQQIVAQQQHQQRLALDYMDQQQFAMVAKESPLIAKMSNDIERAYREITATGLNVSRLDIAKHLIGTRLLEKRAKAASQQASNGKQNIKRQNAPARRSGSDQVSDRRAADDREARRRRLENLVF